MPRAELRWWAWVLMGVLLGACAIRGPQGDDDDDANGDDPGDVTPGQGAADPGGPGGPGGPGEPGGPGSGSSSSSGTPTGSSSSSSSSSSSGSSSSSSGTGGAGGSPGGTGGSGGAGGDGCYTEGYDLGVGLGDLQSGYNGSQWLPTMLETLNRRYHNGWYVLDQMKNDPWLTGSFPQYFSLGSWSGMTEAIDTACHEETHGYDFDKALGKSGKHVYYLGSNLEVTAPKLAFFPRYEILSYVQQGGSVTSMYDSTYLTGTQGSYDFIFLGDELTAYIIGLACATVVGDQIQGGHSYRDGAAAHLYYLQAYLKVARTKHASLYAQWQADPDWQKFVRFSWARGHFWTKVSQKFPALGIDDAAIWKRVNDPGNLSEIQQFTGDDPNVVACKP